MNNVDILNRYIFGDLQVEVRDIAIQRLYDKDISPNHKEILEEMMKKMNKW